MLTAEQLKKVRHLHIKTNHLVNAVVAGHYHSAFRGKGVEFSEVRPYVAGDNVRDIDWNVTARLGDPYIKIYQEERELSVMLLVDLSASGIFGSSALLKRELIAELAAILAFSAIKNNDKVGLILFTDRIEKVLHPKKGRGHVWRLIRELLTFSAENHQTDLALAMKFCNQLLRRRSVVFLLSDFIDLHSNYPRELKRLARRHDLICLKVTDPYERELPNLGLVQVVDPESQIMRLIDSSDPQVRKFYYKNAIAHARQTEKLMQSAQASFADLNCQVDYMPALTSLFQRRERRR